MLTRTPVPDRCVCILDRPEGSTAISDSCFWGPTSLPRRRRCGYSSSQWPCSVNSSDPCRRVPTDMAASAALKGCPSRASPLSWLARLHSQ
eukprot:361775-Rhodomonas_salina.5